MRVPASSVIMLAGLGASTSLVIEHFEAATRCFSSSHVVGFQTQDPLRDQNGHFKHGGRRFDLPPRGAIQMLCTPCLDRREAEAVAAAESRANMKTPSPRRSVVNILPPARSVLGTPASSIAHTAFVSSSGRNHKPIGQ